MANTNLSAAQKYTTVSIGIAGDTVVVPKGFDCKVKNLDPTNTVALSDVSNPASGAAAAGAQTILFPEPASGGREAAVRLFSDKTYFLRAAVAPCLVAFELLPMQR